METKNYTIEMNFMAFLSTIFFAFLITDSFNRIGEMGSCDSFTAWEITYFVITIISIFLMGAMSKIKIVKKK